ncbi:Cd209 antigen-like protein e [Plakobranchus ocellatus]|uniref:Cd209 antigen-like protein e n=1 Tax=Plakobranchus ocellatus TaxID=259542 RepID=A0AAV4ARM1_9GAST|nr:Cd209 antigen-like protein e [Plakobranchus ocellatus]
MRLAIVLFSFKCVWAISSSHRGMYLTKVTGETCQTEQLAEAWSSPSPVTCYLDCIASYPDRCLSTVYNEATGACIPGGPVFGKINSFNESIPRSSPNSALYYENSAKPACNTSNGFALYELCGTTVCLYLSSNRVWFNVAVKSCTDIDSSLFIANTWARFALFWSVSLTYLNKDTYLGLSRDPDSEIFVWGNGEPFSDKMKAIWEPTQPDNWGGSDYCVEVRHYNRPDLYGINDVPCWSDRAFICEPNV